MNKLIKREFLPVGTETQIYVNSKNKKKEANGVRKRWFATMICQDCGKTFCIRERSQNKHLSAPCEVCAKRKINYQKFLKKAVQKHKDRFDYSLVTEASYVNGSTPVTIVCKKHGEFKQAPAHHISKVNAKLCCPLCVQEFNKLHNKRSIESWKIELHKKTPHIKMLTHGNADTNTEKCTLDCEYHGVFESTLASIKNQVYICALCAQDQNSWGGRFRRTDIPGIVYFIYIPELRLWKLGVTSMIVEKRLKQLKFSYKLLWACTFSTLKEAYAAETLLFKTYKNYRRDRTLPKVLGRCGGNSELITCEIPSTAIRCSNASSKEP